MNIENINQQLFLTLNAGSALHGYQLWFAIFAAKYFIFVILFFLMGIWLWGSRNQRLTLCIGFIAVLSALLINNIIGYFWFHPRPFMQGIGNNYLAHAPDSSFPSDHATVLFTISLVFLFRKGARILGILLLVLSLWVAWSRIYVGIHYPFDMLGSLIVSLIVAVFFTNRSHVIEHFCFPSIQYIYQKIFSKAIKLKWVKG